MLRLVVVVLALCSACGGGQSTECQKWVKCSDALPGAIAGSQDAAYGPAGDCWKGSPSDASKCTDQCMKATAAAAGSANAPAECK